LPGDSWNLTARRDCGKAGRKENVMDRGWRVLGVFIALSAVLLLGADDEEYDLRMKLETGQKLYYECTATTTSIMPTATSTKGNRKALFEYTVAEGTYDGSSKVKFDMLSISAKEGGSEYNSKTGKKSFQKVLNDCFDKMMADVPEMLISPHGAVDGGGDIVSAIEEAFGVNKPENAQNASAFRRRAHFFYRATYGLYIYDFMPREPKKIKDTWSVTMELPIMNFQWEAKLRAIRKAKGSRRASVALELKSVNFDSSFAQAAQFEIVKFKGSGKLEFDLEGGRPTLLDVSIDHQVNEKGNRKPTLTEKILFKIKMLDKPPKKKKK
ncbi:MAG: hypothetical protein ACYTAF_08120, partial [Planctomycetota bacterium]|jgi:hypothetical protein